MGWWKKNRQTVFLLSAFSILTVGLRLWYNFGTLDRFYTGNDFRVGSIPWSDAHGWAEGALLIIHGQPLINYPAFRPLTPTFLSLLFTLSGINYLQTMILQGVLLLATLLTAAWLLRDFRPRLPAILFLLFLVTWRPGIETSFITEVPGLLVLIPGFVLLLRGVRKNSREELLTGIFLLGLCQAIRPWNIFSLALLPLLAFRLEGLNRKGVKWFLFYALAGLTGFLFHPASGLLFNHPDEVTGNHDKALYGRVTDQSWMAYYDDPIIKKARENQQLSPRELRRIVYHRTWEKFRENPTLLVKSGAKSILTYFRNLQFALFGMIPQRVWLRWLGVAMAAAGLVYCVRYRHSRMAMLIWLYGAGILLSLPLVGNDGGERIKIGSDILLFWLAALGIAWLASRCRREILPDQETDSRTEQVVTLPAVIALTAAVVFLLWPYLLKRSGREPYPPLKLTKTQAKTMFNLPVEPLDQQDLDQIWDRFPQPSFELYNGRYALRIARFNRRDTLDLKANEGMLATKNVAQFWPLATQDYPRTILVREMGLVIIPRIAATQLARLEDRPVWFYGQILSRPRSYLWATGYVLFATRMGWRLDDGRICMVRLVRE